MIRMGYDPISFIPHSFGGNPYSRPLVDPGSRDYRDDTKELCPFVSHYFHTSVEECCQLVGLDKFDIML